MYRHRQPPAIKSVLMRDRNAKEDTDDAAQLGNVVLYHSSRLSKDACVPSAPPGQAEDLHVCCQVCLLLLDVKCSNII